ncbi:MAG: hypothetical protein CFE21_01210 [Bacteroidetes bacterium B1(2017)]|nr:MAG: hypothetical protein CFE21_01210 [Bacteroidetes bacterium B1(2017)]
MAFRLVWVFPVLVSVFFVFAVGNQVHAAYVNSSTKLNVLSVISANKINVDYLTISKSAFNYSDDSIRKTTNLAPDTLLRDSNYLPRTKSAIKNKVKYNAKDSIVYSASDKITSLYKDALINFEDYEMKAAVIKINMANNTINAVGEADSTGKLSNTPKFKQGSEEYNIEEVTFNYQSKRGLMREFKTQEGDGFIKGERVKRDENNNFYIRDSYYTTCSEDHPHFAINAKKLKVIPGSRVITGPANLTIAGVRTPLFVPFGIFPLKRGQQSGLIIPTYGNAKGRGFFLRQGGYYFGMGNHADLAIVGDIYANMSWMLGGRMNYKKRYAYDGNFSANYAHNKNGMPEDRDFNEFTTFEVTWFHSMDQKAKPGTSFRADVRLVGNQYLAYNTYSTNNTAFTNNINSSVSYSHSMGKGKYNLAATTRASQNTQTRDISVTLPDVTFSVASFQPFKPKWKPTADKWYEKTSINYIGAMQNVLSTKDTLLFKPRNDLETRLFLDSVMRNGARHSITAQNSFNLFKFYTFSVSADYSEVWTLKTVDKTYDPENKSITSKNTNGFERGYQYSFRGGMSTRFYGMVQFKKGRLKAIRHVINPDLSFSYVPDFGASKYGFYKDVQRDSIGNTTQYSIFENALFGGPSRGKQGNINFGIDNNFEIKWKKGKDTSEKIEKIKIFESIRAGGSYNIFADSMNLSNIPISWRTTLFKTIGINGGANLDPYVNKVITSDNGTKYYQRVNEFYLKEQNKLGVITNANIGIGANLTPEMFKSKHPETLERRKKEMSEGKFTEVSIPWSLGLSYTISYDYRSKISPSSQQFVQTLMFNGTVTPTKNWFVNFNSGYDFKLKKISHLGIDLRRDLHCWQFTFNWTPLSAYGNQYFIFNINVKSSVLKDLKIPKRKDWFDARRI